MEAAAFAGRLLLAGIFLHEAWSKLTGYPAALVYMQASVSPGNSCRSPLPWNWGVAS
jgi:uncharacterized membrane protein YphA (DoxX/SURF4 family)